MKLYVGNLNTLTWTGRELTGITMPSSQTMSYKYNSDGIRTQKTFTDNAVKYYYKHDYIVDGANIVAETINYVTYTGINTTEVLYYYYDESGAPTGIKYNNNVYYFQKNLQGDIIRILNSYGSIVATYTYDAWGNIIASTDTSGVSIGTKNPFRYRGYYYDTETGLYYLNSRYYDPQVGRFLNADDVSVMSIDQENLIQYNLYAYCLNNPLNRFDESGNWSLPNLAKIVIGVAATVAAVAITVATGGAAAPVLIGVATSTISGAAFSAVNHRVTTGSWEGALKTAWNGAVDGFMWGGIGAFASSSISAVKAVKTAKQGIAIGENMERVGKAAQVVDATTYKPMKGYNAIKRIPKVGQQLADDLSLAHNKAFITRMTKLGAPIYDTGSVGSTITSRWYAMERQVVNGYYNYVKMF